MTDLEDRPSLPYLPLEILSVIACLLAPANGPPPDEPLQPTPPPSILPLLDPHPHPEITPLHAISLVSRSSHSLLEAARPWLWENVDVRSGRGWLAIVNALTEEVADSDNEDEPFEVEGKVPLDSGLPALGMPLSSLNSGVPGGSAATPQQIPPVEAMRQPSIMNSGPSRYTMSSVPSTFSFPLAPPGSHPQGSAIGLGPAPLSIPTAPYSPPQPPSASLLLTPPLSRHASPHFVIPSSPPRTVPTLPSGPRLRGRSRSRSRSKSRTRIEFDTEGSNAALLARARSVSAHRSSLERDGSWPRRIPLERRRSSLSRVRTREDIEVTHEEEDEDGEDGGDEAMDEDEAVEGAAPQSLAEAMKGNGLERTVSIFSDGEGEGALRAKLDDGLPENDEEGEENWLNVNPELLPPPGPYIRHINFANFRTIGSRRTQEEAVRGRFVTAGRLEGVIKNAPNLVSLGMTEYVDSALSLEVLEELLFRGTKRPRMPRRMSSAFRSLSRVRSISADPSGLVTDSSSTMTAHDQLEPPRPEYVPYEIENEDEMWKRRGMFTPMEALDLTGCVSRNFTEAMQDLWDKWFAPDEGVEEEEEERGRGRGRGRRRAGAGGLSANETDTEADEDPFSAAFRERSSSRNRRRAPSFPHMKRLSLRACLTLDSHRLDTFLLAFPSLTHLDLSNTKISSAFLIHLLERPPRGMRLKSLSLARCPKIDPFVLVDFLVRCPVAEDIVELNLFVNPSQGRVIRSDDLMRLITTAPCFKKGQLRYLDLSSAQFTPEHLAVGVFPPQPCLVSLGLSYLPTLPLPPIAEFILRLAPHVEILTLIGTAHETALRPSAPSLQITLELHARLINPLTTVPFSLSSLNLSNSTTQPAYPNPGPTRLRVVELSVPIRRAIGPEGGSNEWKLIKSKGGRGWLVDVSAGWVKDSVPDSNGVQWRFARHMHKDEPSRKWLMSLSQANGRVGSWVGWHSRKMEVIRGYGMCGREEGMAGAGAFAFEE